MLSDRPHVAAAVEVEVLVVALGELELLVDKLGDIGSSETSSHTQSWTSLELEAEIGEEIAPVEVLRFAVRNVGVGVGDGRVVVDVVEVVAVVVVV